MASAGLAALMAFPLGAASAGTTHPFAAHWLFTQARGATVAVDSSGYEHNGTIEPGVQVSGAGYYRFPGTGVVDVPMPDASAFQPAPNDWPAAMTQYRTSSLTPIETARPM